MIEHLEAIKKVAKHYVRANPEMDYRDLVQDTVLKLLKYPKANEALAIFICKHIFLDTFKTARVKYEHSSDAIEHLHLSYLPDVEEQIECKQLGKDWYNWPERYSSKRVPKQWKDQCLSQ